MKHVCKSSSHCWLTCKGCPTAESASKEEKKAAKKDYAAFCKKHGIEAPR